MATAESTSTAQQKTFPTPQQVALIMESTLNMLGRGTGDGDGVGVGRSGSVAAVPNMKYSPSQDLVKVRVGVRVEEGSAQ
mgnify:CR=1 FL=1